MKIFKILLPLFVLHQISFAQQEIKNEKQIFYDEVKKHEELQKQSIPKDKDKKQEGDKFDRWQWFWSSRIDGDGDINRSVENMKKFIEQSFKNVPVAGAKSYAPNIANWSSIGPIQSKLPSSRTKGDVGHIECLALSPNKPGTMYAAGLSGGIWKTTDACVTWTNLTDNYSGLGGAFDMEVISGAGSTPDIIYTASSVYSNGTIQGLGKYSYGVCLSTDGGTTWRQLNTGINPQDYLLMTKISIHPNNSNVIFALSTNNLYKTTNGGTNWAIVSGLPTAAGVYRELEIDPNNTNIMYIGGDNAFYKSSDGGANWVNLKNIPNSNFSSANFKLTFAIRNNEIYVLYKDMTQAGNIADIIKFSSSVTPTNFITPLQNDIDLGWLPNALQISVSPNGRIYAGMYQFYVFDGTSKILINIHEDPRDMVFPNGINDDVAYIAHDGGISKRNTPATSSNLGSYTQTNGNIAASECYGVATSNYNNASDFLLMGAHDNGTFRMDANDNWNSVQWGDGGASEISPDAVAATSRIDAYSRYNCTPTKSDDGTSWQGLGGTNSPYYNSPIYIDPTNINNVYAISGHYKNTSGYYDSELMYSKDHGQIFNPRSYKIAMDVFCLNGGLKADASNVLNNGLYASGSKSWVGDTRITFIKSTDFDVPGAGNLVTSTDCAPFESTVIKAPVTGIVIKKSSQAIFATLGGFLTGKKIYYSTNGGGTGAYSAANWKNISGNLPNVPTQCIFYDEVNNQCIIGTDAGVFYLSQTDIDNGNYNNWQYFGNIPKIIITQLKLKATTGDLFVSTYGRGVWKTKLPGYCYSGTLININTNTAWNTDQTICADVVVNSGATLTITAKTIMPDAGKITVKSGGILIVSAGGYVENSNLQVLSGGILIIQNDGAIELNEGDELKIDLGAQFEDLTGRVKLQNN